MRATLAGGRHLSSPAPPSSAGARPSVVAAAAHRPISSSFGSSTGFKRSDRHGSANSTGSQIDQRQIHFYLKKQDSRSSMFSTSTGYGGSRPLSAESQGLMSPDRSRKISADNAAASASASRANTRIVMPSGRGGRPIPPPLSRRSLPLAAPPTARPRSHYIGELVFQADDIVYFGGVEAAYNANLLCRLNIEYIVDISNTDRDDLPKQKRSDCPCLCARETAHSRARMAIGIDEACGADLTPYFRDVADFVARAKQCGKAVLMHSFNGRNRAAVFAVQYLMLAHGVPRQRAEDTVRAACAAVRIGDNFYRSLKKWEELIADGRALDDAPARRPPTGARPAAPRGAKRNAWL